ncbi:MAG: hypothetical protein ACM3TR_03190 [Caulobacteraceae bacterium]
MRMKLSSLMNQPPLANGLRQESSLLCRQTAKVLFGACNPKTGEVIYSTEEAGNSKSFENFLK